MTLPRPSATQRLPELVHVAGNVFLAKGYRRAQMADIATAMGVSAGAIYRYVESKEALFDLVLRFESSPDRFDYPDLLPVPTPAPDATVTFVAELLAGESELPELVKALETDTPSSAREEITGITIEMIRLIAPRHRGLKILEKSALDWPALSEIWWSQARLQIVDALAAYIQKRVDAKLFLPVPDAHAAARAITETCAYFALHRHYDPEPTLMSNEVAEETAATVIARTFTREP